MVHYSVLVAKLFVIPGHELDKIVIESNASPTIKGRMDVAVKVSRGNGPYISPGCPLGGPPMPASSPSYICISLCMYFLLRQGLPM